MSLAQPDRITSVGSIKVALLRVWRDVLQVENIRDDDNFFDLGGDSIRSVQIVARANRLGLPLTLKLLFANQSIGELTRVLEPSLAANHSVTAKNNGLNESEVLVTSESLRQFGIEAFREAGLDEEGARRVTEIQLEANLRGQPTHNMVSIPRYARRIAAGVLNARPNIRVEKETPMSALLNGDNAPGQWVAEVAMEFAIRKAQQTGIGIVSAKHSNHFGAAGHYVWKAACEGMIGLCTTNGPVILAPTGGRTPTLGNNPLGVGIPANKYFPVLLDIAMSVAPRGKIALQVREGKSLENDWILDHLGQPSMKLEDLAAGLGVPIGGHKGYGLAFVMEILSGVLSGAGFGLDHRKQDGKKTPHDFGQFFLAFDPELFMPAEQFRSRVDEMIKQAKSAKKMEGVDEILVPGELEMTARQRSLQEGVRLRASTYDSLVKYADEMGLATRIQIIAAGANASPD
ncbi:MAG: Ldh family oxidoreductase [Pirellulaceae bacterium]|nr:Ldh family oxidoreductase [Pirellulaceae bacterium]